MDVKFYGDRAVFSPYTVESDIDHETKRTGMKTYNSFIGFFLNLFGYATKLTDNNQ